MRWTLQIVPETFAIYRLPPHAALPSWATDAPIWSITRTADELSIVCPEQLQLDPAVPCESPWRCLKVQGPLAFTLTGVVAALTQPLADAQISVFVLSTFDTDYLFIKVADFPRAIEALVGAGHEVVP